VWVEVVEGEHKRLWNEFVGRYHRGWTDIQRLERLAWAWY
jgi:hypothetical protein